MAAPTNEIHPGQAAAVGCRIRVAGTLGDEWSRRVNGLSISVQRSESAGSYTELTGNLPDDAALMGVLDVLYTHGARLLSVERVENADTSVWQSFRHE